MNLGNEHIKPYVLAIVPIDDVTDHFALAGGSGVAVQVGARRFIATAAHVLQVPDDRLTVLALGRGDGWAAPGGIIRRGVVSEPHIDVAYLEVDDELASRLACTFFPLERLRPHAGRIHAGVPVVLHGFPGALRTLADPSGLWLKAGAQGFFTQNIETPRGQAAAPDQHVFFDYPLSWHRRSGPEPRLRAEGYSGSGLWVMNYINGKLWIPQHCELVALQTDWHAEHEWIRGTEIQHWLELVARDYTDLRERITEHLEGSAGVTVAG